MRDKQKIFIIYSWLAVIIWTIVIFAASKFIVITPSSTEIMIIGEKLGYLLAFGLLSMLIYRAILGTLIIRLERLSSAKTQREKKEDYEFVRLIEFWVGISSFLITVIIIIFNVLFRYYIGIYYVSLSDVIISALGALIATLVAYYYPLLHDKEYEWIAK